MTKADLKKEEAFDWDESKLVIFSGVAELTGEMLHGLLLQKYHLQMEMVSGDYVLGMTSLMDDKEGLKRLSDALHEIDAALNEGDRTIKKTDFIEKMYQENPREMQIYQAEELPYKVVPLKEADGEMSADTVFLYPPGIPMIVPGERITKRFIQNVEECLKLGLRVESSVDITEKILKIVYF